MWQDMITLSGWLLFTALTVLVVTASRHAWQTKLAYGWFRFLGFQLLSIVITINTRQQFRDPLSQTN
jgi:hypothetical protein